MLLTLVLCAAASILAVDVAAVATSPKVRRAAELEVCTSGNTLVGAGYSGDSQQLTSQKCYSATVSSISGQQGYMQLGTAISFSELESKLGISVSASGGFAMFAADALADYMRPLQDTDHSLSLNYYYYVTNQVNVQIKGDGYAALSESGRTFYRNGSNPYFGLLCGDSYIDSYQQGALLTMGFNIKFNSSDMKNEFTAKASASFLGNIVKAAESINSIASEHKISGTVTIQVFQKGGEPSQLSNLLSKDSSDNYYALGCSITAMNNCIGAASGLLDYAKTNFPLQVSSKKNEGFTPLGMRFSSFRPVEHIGLKRPASLVTKEVEQYRDELSSKLKEAKYYQQKLYTSFNIGYPVELTDTLVKNANSLLAKANMNVDILMHPTTGAAGCFNTPDRCRSIKDKIDSRLHKITASDLEFLDAIKYQFYFSNSTKLFSCCTSAVIPVPIIFLPAVILSAQCFNVRYSEADSVFYAGSARIVWSTVIVPEPCGDACDVRVTRFSVTDTICSFSLEVAHRYDRVFSTMEFTGYSNDGGREYAGKYTWIQHKNETVTRPKLDAKLVKRLSPFFFESFSANNNHR